MLRRFIIALATMSVLAATLPGGAFAAGHGNRGGRGSGGPHGAAAGHSYAGGHFAGGHGFHRGYARGHYFGGGSYYGYPPDKDTTRSPTTAPSRQSASSPSSPGSWRHASIITAITIITIAGGTTAGGTAAEPWPIAVVRTHPDFAPLDPGAAYSLNSFSALPCAMRSLSSALTGICSRNARAAGID